VTGGQKRVTEIFSIHLRGRPQIGGAVMNTNIINLRDRCESKPEASNIDQLAELASTPFEAVPEFREDDQNFETNLRLLRLAARIATQSRAGRLCSASRPCRNCDGRRSAAPRFLRRTSCSCGPRDHESPTDELLKFQTTAQQVQEAI
jgi:hypothetical protein